MHWAFDATGRIYEATNEGATAVRTAVLDGVNDSAQVEESDLDIVNLDELTAAWGQLLKTAGCDPLLGGHL